MNLLSGHNEQLGAVWDGSGTNFALFSEHAERVELCLFDASGRHETHRMTLPEHTDGVWHGYAPDLTPGALYGYRVHGPYEPELGHRFNPHKLLVDPYARRLSGPLRRAEAQYGFRFGHAREDLSLDRRDSARTMPKCVVVDPAFTWGDEPRARVAWPDTIIYEAHVRGMTRLHPDVAEAERGTFAGFGHRDVVSHLQALGVTTVELLPVQAFADEAFLAAKGLRNYWGYNTLCYFAPQPQYLSGGEIQEFKSWVRRLHDAGLEVILDVVYNHTAEGSHTGPTLSFRGIDNASYYRLQAGNRRYYVNDTGCGNTLNLSHPRVLQMVMDSLRYWVSDMHVDGFRFDLASTLARTDHGFDPRCPFLQSVRQDPTLSRVKLIAEPWDIGPGGYQLGGFPPGWSEWNDRYRDTVRRFWRGDAGMLPELARRLHGSSDLFENSGRRPWASVNFVTSHDGFTLADLVAYQARHNEANGEDNRDGHHENFSVNHGIEGPSDEPAVLEARDRHRRNLLATLLLSQGTPMLLGGDELGRSQAGNNNAYCQDNEISWVRWDASTARDRDFLHFVRYLIRFRQAHPVLRRPRHVHGPARSERTGLPEIQWLAPDGCPMGHDHWSDPASRAVGWLMAGDAGREGRETPDDTLLILFNGGPTGVQFTLPEAPDQAGWRLEISTGIPDGRPTPRAIAPGESVALDGHTLNVLVLAYDARME